MGIRYEKDTILNWINEMGKFLRLVADKWDTGLKEIDKAEWEEGYAHFFKVKRVEIEELDSEALQQYVDKELHDEQIRPLALLLMYDGFSHENNNLLTKSKMLLEYYTAKTGSFSFEDAAHLTKIDAALKAGH